MQSTWYYGRKPCGRELQMSRHMKNTCNTHEETCGHAHGNYGWKPCARELQMSRHMQSTCDAHEETCGHMVITGGSSVDANYKCLVT